MTRLYFMRLHRLTRRAMTTGQFTPELEAARGESLPTFVRRTEKTEAPRMRGDTAKDIQSRAAARGSASKFRKWATVVGAVLVLTACQTVPKSPAVTPGPMSATTSPNSVTVVATGPPTWSYVLKSSSIIAASGPGNFSAVQIHSNCPISTKDVAVLFSSPGVVPPTFAPAPTAPTPVLTQIAPSDVRIDSNSAPLAGWAAMVITVTADCRNGAVTFTFQQGGTTPPPAVAVVGPVAGPE